MTEYDYSEEGYRRYLDSQNRISRWVDNTNSHSREFRPPFGARSDVPSEGSRSLNSSPAPSAVRSVTRPHEYHGTTSGNRSRSGSDASRRRSLAHPSPLGMGTERYDVPRGLAFAPSRPSPLAAPVPRSYPQVPLATQIPPPNPMHPTASSHHLSRGLEMHVSSSRPPQYDVSRPRSQSSHSRHDTPSHRSHTVTPSHHTATHNPSRSHTLPASMQMPSSSLSRPHHDSDEYRSRPRPHRDSHDYESKSPRSHSSSHDSSRHSRHSSSHSSHKHHHRRSQSLSIGSGTTAYTIATPTFISPNPNNSAAPLVVPFAETGDRKTYVASIPPVQAPGYTIIPPKGKTVKVIL
ncbi:hypothetical protein WG66_003114 [Moniliophthora roreri]|nr:hypothetical protein WG66_003114 [Moniliophthora roreri]